MNISMSEQGQTISDVVKFYVVFTTMPIRSVIARCAEAYEIVPGTHIHLSREGNNPLYIILSGSVKAEVKYMVHQKRVSQRGWEASKAANVLLLCSAAVPVVRGGKQTELVVFSWGPRP